MKLARIKNFQGLRRVGEGQEGQAGLTAWSVVYEAHSILCSTAEDRSRAVTTLMTDPKSARVFYSNIHSFPTITDSDEPEIRTPVRKNPLITNQKRSGPEPSDLLTTHFLTTNTPFLQSLPKYDSEL